MELLLQLFRSSSYQDHRVVTKILGQKGIKRTGKSRTSENWSNNKEEPM